MMHRNRWYVVAVALALGACRLGESTPTPTAPGTPDPSGRPRTEPMVRVGIKLDTAAVFITSTTAAAIVDREGKTLARADADERWTFTSDEAGSIRATGADGESTASTAVPLTVRPADEGFVRIGDKVYRGDVIVRTAGPGRVSAI